MKVEGPGKTGAVTPGRIGKAAGDSSGEFSRLVENGAASPGSAVSGAQAATSVDALLSLQEVDDATERKGRARKRAGALLDNLDEIRHGLLMGEISPHQLRTLRDRIAAERPAVDDPKLTELLNEIELRAEVELAKLESHDN